MTKKEKDDKVSYSVVAGELRKASRLYEVFKHASEAADVLAAFEREKKTLSTDISKLVAEKQELDDSCNTVYHKQKQSELATKEAKEQAEKFIQKAKVEADTIKSKATTYAAKVKDEYEGILVGINDKIVAAKNEMNESIGMKNDALAALAKVEKQIQEAKNKFLATLGS